MGLAIVSQLPCLLLSGLTLDGGIASRVVVIAMLAHWASTGMIVIRNPDEPGGLDLAYIGISFFVLVILTFAAADWRLGLEVVFGRGQQHHVT
jgi:hypothetical protein